MLITKTVKIKWNGKTRKHYEEKGYIFTKFGDEFEVDIKDLSDGSHALVNVECDCEDCKNSYLKPMEYRIYKKCVHKDGKYYCQKCGNKLFTVEKRLKTMLLNGESFYDWCYRNLPREQADEIMARWDYDLNRCSPSEISYSSNGFNKKGYWFKCLKHLGHGSELKSISSFIRGQNGSIECNGCNSFAQWGIDNICSDFLEKYWDYSKNVDKNGNPINPWKVSKTWNKKVWIKCQKKDYHGSYPVSCANFTFNNSRCPYCATIHGKVHPLDSLGQYIINNYGKEFLDKIWSEKNKKSAFEYTLRSEQRIYWKCLNGKHKDYKRTIDVSYSCEFRCPECVNEMSESIIQEKTRLYLEENYGQYKILHEGKCTLKPKNIIEPPNNSNKKRGKGTLRYDNEIVLNNMHLFIEVMGSQHKQESSLYHKQTAKKYNTTPQQELEYLQNRDKYKEQYVYDQGKNYYYLAVWHYDFDKQDTYKKLINNKLNEILNKEGETING